jgi:hypothetical protein
MRNNRFLNKKENNRFKFLNDDDTDNSSLKNKQNKKKVEYEPSKNSFTQPLRERVQQRYDDGYKHRDRDINRWYGNKEYEHINNRFKSDTKKQLPQVEIDFNNTELFPELIDKKENNINDNSDMLNFKYILNNIEDTPKNTDKILPGWIQITMVNKKVVIENGPPTLYSINMEKQKELENDINYNINNIVKAMTKIYEENEKSYDSINGEGAYEERFKLLPVYGPEYDSEGEEINNDDNEYYDNDDFNSE